MLLKKWEIPLQVLKHVISPFLNRAYLCRFNLCGFFPFGGLSNLELDPITFLQGALEPLL
jgi:hypothetical protein